MKKILFTLLALAALAVAAVFYPPVRALAITYGEVLLNDGTNVWVWTSTVGGDLVLGEAAGSNIVTVDPVAGTVQNVATVSTLPTCNTARKGAMWVVTDASSPTFNATLTGSSSTTVGALCNGSNWVAF